MKEKDVCASCGWEGYGYLKVTPYFATEEKKLSLCRFCAVTKLSSGAQMGMLHEVEDADTLIAVAQMFNALSEKPECNTENCECHCHDSEGLEPIPEPELV